MPNFIMMMRRGRVSNFIAMMRTVSRVEVANFIVVMKTIGLGGDRCPT